MADRRWDLSAESITAIAAVVTAIIALAVGIWDNVETRRHNRLSVIPHLELVAEIRTERADTVGRATLTARNEGVGPAVLEEMRIRVPDPSGEDGVYESWSAAIPAIERLGVRPRRYVDLGRGAVFGVGREFVLASFEAEDDPGESPGVIRELLERIGVVLVYRSVYGDEYRATFNAE